MRYSGLLFITDNPATNHVPDYLGMLVNDENMDTQTFKRRYPEIAGAFCNKSLAGQDQLAHYSRFGILIVTDYRMDSIDLWRSIGKSIVSTIWIDTVDPVVAWQANDDFIKLQNHNSTKAVMSRFNPSTRFRHWLSKNKSEKLFG